MAVEGVCEFVLTDAWFGLLTGKLGGEALWTNKALAVRKAISAYINIVVGERSTVILLDAVATGESYTPF